MARQKGDGRGRLGGRSKGTPNKVTTGMREWLSDLIDNNREQMERDLQTLEPRERLHILERFMQYVLPKRQAVSASVDIDKLSDEQLDELINTLTKEMSYETTD